MESIGPGRYKAGNARFRDLYRSRAVCGGMRRSPSGPKSPDNPGRPPGPTKPDKNPPGPPNPNPPVE